MRSRASRLVIGAVAWIAFALAGYLLVDLERQILARRASSDGFDIRSHDVTAAIADIRVAQQASVAEGQDSARWAPRIEALVAAAANGLDRLAASTTDVDARTALAGASDEMARLTVVGENARAHIVAGERAAASDLILTEGGRAAVAAARHVERARSSERQEAAAFLAETAQEQRIVLLGAGIAGAFVILLLALARTQGADDAVLADTASGMAQAEPGLALSLAQAPRAFAVEAPQTLAAPEVPPGPSLADASAICASIEHARGSADLQAALERAAALMGATGLIVWQGTLDGGPLEPVAACGYSPEALARIPTVPRGADNAVARAYRTGTLQVAASRAADRPGAVAAPILSPGGSVGAFTAELPGGREGSAEARALATLFASQFATLLGSPALQPSAAAAHDPDRATA